MTDVGREKKWTVNVNLMHCVEKEAFLSLAVFDVFFFSFFFVTIFSF